MTITERNKHRAINIARNQGWLPNSPGAIDKNGKYAYCAAACVAVAYLEDRGGKFVDEFTRQLVSTNDKNIVQNVFEQSGFSRADCKEIMDINDASPLQERLSMMENLINGISAV